MPIMDKTLVKVAVEDSNEVQTWTIHGERIKALTDFLDWAEKQRLAEDKRTEISRRVRAKKGGRK